MTLYTPQHPPSITWVIASLTAGGIGPVCRYAAHGVSQLTGWKVTLLSLHDPVGELIDEASGIQIICLGLSENCPQSFLAWLAANPQDLIITSDVSHIEGAYRFIPQETRHIVQIHESLRRYREVAVRNAKWIDGVTCVGRHIEAPLRKSLDDVSFQGLMRTVHNGANFPPLIHRPPHDGPLRLLFMGRVEALKGVFDFVPLLCRLRKLGVPVTLNIVGGENETLRRQFLRRGLADCVTWSGRVPHEQCYAIAAESDIFLMTSRKEPFGMVTIEAMSMGCVPIAYDVPSGSSEIIEHGKSGLLVPLGDIKAWVAQIQKLHLDRNALGELSASAIERSRNQFGAGLMAANMASFLEDVLTHAEIHSSRRESGPPPDQPSNSAKPARGYQRLPEGLRVWIRNRICASPRVSFWLLNR